MNNNDEILNLIIDRVITTYPQFRIQMDIRGMNLTKELFSRIVYYSKKAPIFDFLNNVFFENCEFLDCIKKYPDVFCKLINNFESMIIYDDNCEDIKQKYGYIMSLYPFLNRIWKIRPGILLNYYFTNSNYFINNTSNNLLYYETFLSDKCEKLKNNDNFKPYYDKFIEKRKNIHNLLSLIK